MKILFILTVTTLIRHFESVIAECAARGHTVRIATPPGRDKVPLPEALAAHPGISQVSCPGRRGDQWKDPIRVLRALADYLHYLDGPFLPADKLRVRAFRALVKTATDEEKTHVSARCPNCHKKVADDDLGRMVTAAGSHGMRNLNELLQLIERAVPSDARHEEFLRSERPDVVLVTPLISLGSLQADYVKSAKALEVPVGFPVFSWDNLTTKGIVHVQPDRVFVWNDIQKDEAIRYHGVEEDRITVTGAPRFDDFFALKPRTTREKFCAKFGVDPSQPVLTYLCSSEFVAGGEADFVRQWIREIRAEPALTSCGILIRPHPRLLSDWRKFDLSEYPNVGIAMSPRMNGDQLLYDTLHHSVAAVGLNTSAQLEAGIAGKPVYTILAPGFERGQQKTLHFGYLLQENGGFVHVARDFDQHRAQLTDAVGGRYDPARISRFIEQFVRPGGLSKPATPILADAIEALAKPRARSFIAKMFEGVR